MVVDARDSSRVVRCFCRCRPRKLDTLDHRIVFELGRCDFLQVSLGRGTQLRFCRFSWDLDFDVLA